MKISVADGNFEAFVARPTVPRAAVIVVIQEIFGVNKDVRQTCEELAAHGFIAIAPELFWREAPGLELNSWNEKEWAQALTLYQAFDVDRGVRDVAATIEAARTIDGATGKVGVMGFCLGGLVTFLSATRTSVDAAAAYYGGGTDNYLGEAAQLKTPLIVHLGEIDEFIPQAAQASIKKALAGKQNVEVFGYPGCYHAFARHTGSHYDAAAATLANGRTLDFFRRALV